MATDPEERLLWAKYLDWCSARIAERFLELTPEEIYQLAHDASFEFMEEGVSAVLSSNLSPFVTAGRGSPLSGASPRGETAPRSSHAAPGSRGREAGHEVDPAEEAGAALSYRALVERVTEALMERMELPPFEDWRAVYRADPDRYEAELLGFWTEWD